MRKGFNTGDLIVVIVVLAHVVGWVMNLVKVFQISAPISDWGVMEIVRVGGIFVAPVGSIVGYF